MSSTTIDNGLWNIQREIMHKYGCNQADRAMMPLYWYINTGRASCDFLRLLFDAKPFVIARVLVKGGSDEEVINAVCRKIGYNRAK